MPAVQTLGSEPLDVDEDFSEAIADEMAREPDQPKRSVRTMIATTSMSLKRHVDRLRNKETELEATKAAATVEYERAIAQAKLERDNCHAETDADLHQIRTTLEVLDPARAKLSEMA
jgi:hypothetical protein